MYFILSGVKILLIEDDEAIVRLLDRGLTGRGYELVSSGNGRDGLTLATKDASVGLVLLDVSLPELDGHKVLELIRQERPDLPVLMLTARDDVKNKVRALDSGADDYLTKPFAFEELTARIRVLARRFEPTEPTELRAGVLHIDLLAHQVRQGGRRVELSSREFALLACFMGHRDQVLSRQQILSEIWGYDFDPGSNVVDVYVRYLRQKIDEQGKPSYITTIRGVGYKFDVPED